MATKTHAELTGDELHDNKPFTFTGDVTTAPNVTSGDIEVTINAEALDTAINASDIITDLQADQHEHANKALLDTYTQTEANIADSIAKKHTRNTDTKLDEGGTDEISASSIRGHILSSSNPHNVTATQVGKSIAQWNADKIKGITTPTPVEADDGKALLYDHATTSYILGEVEGGGSGSVSDWGDIGGTLSDQTDLQTALDAKQNALGYSPVDKTGDSMSGGLSFTGNDHTGLTVNSLSTAERDAIVGVNNGTIIYNTTESRLEQYVDDAWSAVGSGSGGGGASALDDLTDVEVSSPQLGDTLTYNGTVFTNTVSTNVFTFVDNTTPFEFL